MTKRRYTVRLTPRAERALQALPSQIQTQLARHIDALAENPRPPGCKKLKGLEGLYRIRSGDYRVLYTVADKTLLILVVKLGHRSDIYDRL